MGREIRRVNPNHEHPKDQAGDYISLFDGNDFDQMVQYYQDDLKGWETKPHGTEETAEASLGSPPAKKDYTKPISCDPEKAWYQMYQTVSEGTPCTPPFATKNELIHYLATEMTFWGEGPYTLEQATAFVEQEWAPSFVFIPGEGLKSGIEAAGNN